MLTYRNKTQALLYLDDEYGRKIVVQARGNTGDSFQHNAYFRQMAQNGGILEITFDDDSQWYFEGPYSTTGRVPYSITKTISAGTTYATVGNNISFLSIFNGPAISLQVNNDSGGSAVNMRINTSNSAIVHMGVGESVHFAKDELLVSHIEFENTTGSAATVEITAVGR